MFQYFRCRIDDEDARRTNLRVLCDVFFEIKDSCSAGRCFSLLSCLMNLNRILAKISRKISNPAKFEMLRELTQFPKFHEFWRILGKQQFNKQSKSPF